jgi:hypothetical protein
MPSNVVPPAPADPTLHAVLTGDIVGSSDLTTEERSRLPDVLRAAHRAVQERLQANILYPIDLFGGDSWQMYLPRPEQALAVATHFRADLFAETGITTRIALAIDTIDFLNTEKLSESDGAAFRRSGRLLRELRHTETAVVLPEADEPLTPIAGDLIARIVDHLAGSWTRAQAQAIAHSTGGLLAGEPLSQSRIGEAWTPKPISQQAVARHLQSAGWDILEATLRDFARVIQSISIVA